MCGHQLHSLSPCASVTQLTCPYHVVNLLACRPNTLACCTCNTKSPQSNLDQLLLLTKIWASFLNWQGLMFCGASCCHKITKVHAARPHVQPQSGRAAMPPTAVIDNASICSTAQDTKPKQGKHPFNCQQRPQPQATFINGHLWHTTNGNSLNSRTRTWCITPVMPQYSAPAPDSVPAATQPTLAHWRLYRHQQRCKQHQTIPQGICLLAITSVDKLMEHLVGRVLVGPGQHVQQQASRGAHGGSSQVVNGLSILVVLQQICSGCQS